MSAETSLVRVVARGHRNMADDQCARLWRSKWLWMWFWRF